MVWSECSGIDKSKNISVVLIFYYYVLDTRVLSIKLAGTVQYFK